MAIKFVVYAIGLIALASSVGANSLVEEYARKFSESRKALDQDTLSVAEGFASKIGASHFYRFKLNTVSLVDSKWDNVNFDGFVDFRNSLNQELRLVRQADATIEFLTESADNGKPFVATEDLVDKPEATKQVEQLIVPACERYVAALEGIFNAPELVEAEQDGKLSSECKSVGGSKEVKEFVMGWAHYHICKLLARGERATLIDRVAKRAQDKLRIAQRG